jgi:Domain of unknown function (DUF4157)
MVMMTEPDSSADNARRVPQPTPILSVRTAWDQTDSRHDAATAVGGALVGQPVPLQPRDVPLLQSTLGNQAVARLVQRATLANQETPVGPEGGQISDQVAQRVRQQQGSGTQLGPSLRRRMESGFGTGFSDVRVHSGDEAAKLNGQLKRIAQYIATGRVVGGAKLMHDDFLTGDRQGAPGAIDRQTRRSAAPT